MSVVTCLEVSDRRYPFELDTNLLKGGLSFLSSQYGWAANNVVNYEVVLANATIVNANKDENQGKEDLSLSDKKQMEEKPLTDKCQTCSTPSKEAAITSAL